MEILAGVDIEAEFSISENLTLRNARRGQSPLWSVIRTQPIFQKAPARYGESHDINACFEISTLYLRNSA